VEVKCHCPFALAGAPAARGGARRARRALVARDDGPLRALPAWAVPQLQLEALCVGPHCGGAYLVSLSHSRGAAVWFLRRDDAFVEGMLVALAAGAEAAAARRAGGDGARAAAAAAGAPARAAAALRLAGAAASLARRARLVARVPEDAVLRAGAAGGPLFWGGAEG